MIKRKMMSNLDIYNTANNLAEYVRDNKDVVLPVKVNFFLQKNMNELIVLAKEIEESRVEIIKKYGAPDENNPDQFFVPDDRQAEATKELEDLFALEQEVPINMLKLDWFENINLSGQQVASLTYMIDDEE